MISAQIWYQLMFSYFFSYSLSSTIPIAIYIAKHIMLTIVPKAIEKQWLGNLGIYDIQVRNTYDNIAEVAYQL